MHEFWRTYGRITLACVVLGLLLVLDDVFTGPLAFVSGTPQPVLEQWVAAAFCLVATILISRYIRLDILGGMIPRRTGKQMPQLVIDLAGALVIFIGFCFILAVVFKRDITALVATGGASVMVIGLALRDMLLAAFTGVLLNVEKPLKPGDAVRINDKWAGRVEKITWRATYLVTGNEERMVIPNLMLANAVIVNLAEPDMRSKRSLEVVIDYDTSVDSAERILYAAVLGAGAQLTNPPTVVARKLERDGVLYIISYCLTSYTDGSKSDHAVIKNVLRCMQDAGITVSFPKQEIISSPRRARIADRSMDILRLVQQCKVFRGLPVPVTERVATALRERHFPAGATIVNAGERRDSLFIVGEGMVKRTLTDRDGSRLITERFISTEAFGRRALFACQSQRATAVAETAVLVYELDRRSLAAMLEEDPTLLDTLSVSLAHLAWRESPDSIPGVEPDPSVIHRLTNLNRGQLQAAYMPSAKPLALMPTAGNAA